MHDLITRLSAEHTELQQALAGIRHRQFRTGEGRTRLERVRSLFNSHVSTEQVHLLPKLEQVARNDRQLATRLANMTNELRIVQSLAEEFFSKYREGGPQLIEFSTDHGALLTILTIRLRREEDLLFPLLAR